MSDHPKPALAKRRAASSGSPRPARRRTRQSEGIASPELISRLQRKEAELSALRDISRAIGAAVDLDSTLTMITQKTAEVMAMDSCSIYLLEPSGEYLILRATTGLAGEAVGRARLRWGEGMTGWAAREAAPVASSDAARDPRFVYLPGTREQNFRSLAAVPLVTADRVLGAMNVQTTAVHEYSPEEIELLGTIGDLAAGAIEKATLHDKMRMQIAELSTLAEVSKTLTSPLYLEEMLGVIVEMAARLTNADRCALLLLDQETGTLIPTAAHGAESGREAEAVVALGAEALAENRPAPVTDLRERDIDSSLRAALAVPLTVRDKAIGVFLALRERPHRWRHEEIERLSTLAHQTALAIENSTLVVRSAVVREMHHRVKNNLQTIAMLLRLQMRDGREVSGREVLTETVNRILSIAAVHEILSVEGFRVVNVRELLDRVARSIAENMTRPPLRVDVTITGDDLYLASQPASSLALAVNELVQNALEHAFPERTHGHIEIRLAARDHDYVVEVADDGIGLRSADASSSQTLGLRIVHALVTEDLQGRLEISSDAGTRATITLPKPEPA